VQIGAVRLATLTALALLGFAANSLLCRQALGDSAIDAASFTTIRLASGAVVLMAITRMRSGRWRGSGSFSGAAALFAYAAAFSWAYLRLEAGTGALILFGAVQLTMLGWGIRRGERPGPVEWLGLAVAVAGFVALTRPGGDAPDAIGSGLMVTAGVAWGVYSLLGRGAARPLVTTTDNFVRALPFAAALSLATLATIDVTVRGALLAATSGAIASGIGYSLWYAALPHMPATRAAILQLAVPAIAAAGGVVVLGETLSTRILLSAAAILGGVGLALVGRRR